MDRRRSIFIVNFFHRIQEKRCIKVNGRGRNVFMDPASKTKCRTPSKYCDCGMSLYPPSHAFIFPGCDRGNLQKRCFSFYLYLPCTSILCNSSVLVLVRKH